VQFTLPEIGEGVYEAEMVAWLIKAGDTVKRGQNLLEIMTDKATMDVPSPFIGTIAELKVEPGQKIKVGDVLLTYEGVDQSPPVAVAAAAGARAAVAEQTAVAEPQTNNTPAAPALAATRSSRVPVKASPSVRQLARSLGVDLNDVHGTGPQGRVLIDDLKQHVHPAPAVKRPVAENKPDYGKPGTRIKMQGVRRKIAEHMVKAKQTIPHYTYVDECDVTDLVKLRDSLRETFNQAGVKLTYLPFFVKAVIAALKEVPIVNASLVEADGEIVLHDRYNIGIAVSTQQGLMVPVIQDADRKDIPTLAREIERLSNEARNGKAKREDLRGGTFTITSVGNLGGLFSSPVINHPEVGILGLGKIVRRPVYDASGQVRPADLIYLSLAFDHRVVDGAVGAVFTNAILRQMKNPAAMLLDVVKNV
jgi:pyruvate dehydrogenase E2 component (dihydrolipoamide acetyltransferase)/2-oxoisovalerate dehydrogenase E2 component (dihydrolipoyl transacylase)